MSLWLRESFRLLKTYLAVGVVFAIWGLLFEVVRTRGILDEQQALICACVMGFATAQAFRIRLNRPVPMVFVAQTTATDAIRFVAWWERSMAYVPILTFTMYLGFVSAAPPAASSDSTSLAGAENISIPPFTLNN